MGTDLSFLLQIRTAGRRFIVRRYPDDNIPTEERLMTEK